MDDAVVILSEGLRKRPGPSWRERVVRIVLAVALGLGLVVLGDYVHGWWVHPYRWFTVALVAAILVPAVKKPKPRKLEPGPWTVRMTDVGPKPIGLLKVLRDYGVPFMTAEELQVEVTGRRGGLVVVQGVAELHAKLLERRLGNFGATAVRSSDEENPA